MPDLHEQPQHPDRILPALSTPAYGGDWSPEQWDQQTIDADIEIMVEAGVNLISLGIFSWAFLEPSEGTYDFDWLEQIVDKLHAAGIYTDLATGTASSPAWMAATHPDSLPVKADGTRMAFGSRQAYCPSSPTYARASRALAEQLAKRFANHPGVIMWHINNEYGCHTAECFCDQCAAAFRAWLADRYDTIEALNQAWGTAFWSQRYTDFAHIYPPRQTPTFPNPTQSLDWRRFCNNQLLALCQAEKAALRQYSDKPVTTNFMGDFPVLDYRQWAEQLDIISDDSYPDPRDQHAAHEVAWSADLMRGLGRGKPWLLMEQAPSAVQWRTRNSPKRPGQFLLWSLARMAHGADGILQFQWRQSVAGAETFHSAMLPHAGKASRTWAEVVRTGQVLRRLGPVLGAPYRAQVAIIVDWPSSWAQQAAVGPTPATHFTRARAWHQSLWEAGVAVDVVGPDADVSGYSLIIVAALFMDHPSLAAALETAARSGAQVLVEGPTGVVDHNLHACTGGYLGSLRQLLGVRVVDHAALSGSVSDQGAGAAPVGALTADPSTAGAHTGGLPTANARGDAVNRLTRAVGTPAAQSWTGLAPSPDAPGEPLRRSLDRLGSPTPDLRAGMWAEEIAPNDASTWADADAQIVAFFDGRGGGTDLAGMPALTRRRLGSGGLRDAGRMVGGAAGAGGASGGGAAWYAACDLDALSRRAVLDVLCAFARVRPVLDGLPDGVEAQQRGDYLFLLNHSDRAVELSGIVGTDLVDGGTCSGHVMLAPRSAMVVDQA